jgi:hypothetical protein
VKLITSFDNVLLYAAGPEQDVATGPDPECESDPTVDPPRRYADRLRKPNS